MFSHRPPARFSAAIIASSCGSALVLRVDLKRKVDGSQSVAMNTSLCLCILWLVLAIGPLCAVDTHQSPTKRTKTLFKAGEPIPKPKKLSITGSSSIYRAPERSPAFRRRTKGPSFSGSPRESRAEIQSDFAYVPDVSVTCSTSGFVLRVKPGFYGLGADADELTLGGACRSNGLLRPYGDLLFTYPLLACDAVRHQVRSPHVLLPQF